MKDIEIHEGLSNQVIRDYLSQQMVDAILEGFDNEKQHNPCHPNETYEWAKADAKLQIEVLQRYIQNIEKKQAIGLLIKQRDWIEFDVSDYVNSGYTLRFKMTFIGTKEEHEKLLEVLNTQE